MHHSLKRQDDYLFEVPTCGSPVTLLEGEKTRKTIERAGHLTARYSDAEPGAGEVPVKYGPKLTMEMKVFGKGPVL